MVVFYAGGTGHPYFSTDTTAVLRAVEIDADALLLAKAVDGVYDSDPKDHPDAKKYTEVSIREVIDRQLQVVDMTASILAMENRMPMIVFGPRGFLCHRSRLLNRSARSRHCRLARPSG